MTAAEAREIRRGDADFEVKASDLGSTLGRAFYRIGVAASMGQAGCLVPAAAGQESLSAAGFDVSPVPYTRLVRVSWE